MNIRTTRYYDTGISPQASLSRATILDEIIANKKLEVEMNKQVHPVSELESRPNFHRETVSLAQSLRQQPGIISEFKRRSPSKGVINDTATVAATVAAYDALGAAGISILTDEKYFGGTNNDLLEGRIVTAKPILRKDFIIDEYQLVEAKSIGADVILLIAANLPVAAVKQLARLAKELTLEVLLEIHTEEELDHVCEDVDMVGINNRNLKNFEVDIEHSIRLAGKLPAGKPKIAESGISNAETLLYLKQQGFDGFLMGEHFMKQPDPAIAFANFVTQLSW